MPRGVRVLDPLPLFDEASLLTAFRDAQPEAIPPIHAQRLWKHLLRQELDQFHPGYIERINSRMGSRAASRAASRLVSRRGSVDRSASSKSESIAEEDFKSDDGLSSEASSVISPRSHTSIISEGDEAAATADESGAPDTDAASNSDLVEDEATAARRFELERQARLKLEAEDDQLLAGLNQFPRSRFNPTAEELADPDNPLHTKAILPGTLHGLPARLYPLLASKFSYLTSRLQSHKTSCDGSTTKLLIRLQDGQHIESVIMRHKQKDVATGNVEQRITLCVSSQVGCAMACSFCSTGTMGFRGNLLAGEILEQLIIANRFEKIRNIVFMGMGEPLKNYEQVLAAIRAMTDGNRFGLAPSRITLSTVGVIPKMLELTRDIPSIQLALSLHAPTQELRQQIVPTAKSYPIEKLVEAMDYFIQRSKKRILVEYVLLDGVNASEKEAHELGQLLKGKDVMINLIPYNSTSVAAQYHAPSRPDSQKFQSILTDEYNLFTTIRVEMGADINGACGQLALENQNLEFQLKPRGLADDTATPTILDEEKANAAVAGCASTDIEDYGRSVVSKKPTSATVTKRRTANAPASSPTADVATSSESSLVASACANDPASCECGESTPCCSSPIKNSGAVATSAPETATADNEADEEVLTVGELLAQHGLKTYAQQRADTLAAAERERTAEAATRTPASAPLLSTKDEEKLRAQKQHDETPGQRTDRLQQLLAAVLFILAALAYTAWHARG